MTPRPYFVANRPVSAGPVMDVVDTWSGAVGASVHLADAAAIEAGIAAAAAAAEPMRRLAVYERQAVLDHCVARFRERAAELADALCLEAGKPIRDARGEVTRLIDTFRVAGELVGKLDGAVMDLDITARARGYRGMWRRVPVGPVSLITPFNFPLNLVAHKVAPAIAAGCPFVLKPSPRTPLGALLIGEILAETTLPAGAFSVLPCRDADADPFVTDPRLKLLSFTGGRIGWALRARAGKKKVVLELGGNAACIVCADADVDDAVARLVFGAFYQSGQSCISVQRILVQDTIYEELRDKLVVATRQLKMGDPRAEDTFIGPLIHANEAMRVDAWISEAITAGGRLLCGGRREGAFIEPTLLEDVPETCKVVADEVFAPVAVLTPFSTFEEAIARVNASAYGLQAGVFTRDLYRAQQAWDDLDVGGVVIGDVPSWRVDHMPYGGVKDSGLGREGVRFAMEDMTEIRLMVIRPQPPR